MNHDFEKQIETIINKLRIKKSIEEDKEIENAIKIIKDEKLRWHNPELAREKAKKLKDILKKKEVYCPKQIDYIIASTYLEGEIINEDEAINIYSNILNDPKIDMKLRNRTKFMMCKALLNKSYDLDIEKISNYISDLSKYISENNEYQDEYVIGGLYELKQKLKDLDINKEFFIEGNNIVNDEDKNYFFTQKEALNSALATNSDIVINLINNTVYINNKIKVFSQNEVKILNYFYRESNSEDIIESLGVERDNFYQIVKRLRSKLKSFGINTVPRPYKFDSNVKLVIVKNTLDWDN